MDTLGRRTILFNPLRAGMIVSTQLQIATSMLYHTLPNETDPDKRAPFKLSSVPHAAQIKLTATRNLGTLFLAAAVKDISSFEHLKVDQAHERQGRQCAAILELAVLGQQKNRLGFCNNAYDYILPGLHIQCSTGDPKAPYKHGGASDEA